MAGSPGDSAIAIARRIAGLERPVILVEGSRNVPDGDRLRLVTIRPETGRDTFVRDLPTGGASGADEAFTEGIRLLKGRKPSLLVNSCRGSTIGCPPRADNAVPSALDLAKRRSFEKLAMVIRDSLLNFGRRSAIV